MAAVALSPSAAYLCQHMPSKITQMVVHCLDISELCYLSGLNPASKKHFESDIFWKHRFSIRLSDESEGQSGRELFVAKLERFYREIFGTPDEVFDAIANLKFSKDASDEERLMVRRKGMLPFFYRLSFDSEQWAARIYDGTLRFYFREDMVGLLCFAVFSRYSPCELSKIIHYGRIQNAPDLRAIFEQAFALGAYPRWENIMTYSHFFSLAPNKDISFFGAYMDMLPDLEKSDQNDITYLGSVEGDKGYLRQRICLLKTHETFKALFPKNIKDHKTARFIGK